MNDEIVITRGNGDALYRRTDDVVADARWIVEESRRFAHAVADQTLTRRNWALGRRIAEEELGGAERADYGESVIVTLAKELTSEYGRGFGKTNLYQFVKFYREFPEIFHSQSGKSAQCKNLWAGPMQPPTPCPASSACSSRRS